MRRVAWLIALLLAAVPLHGKDYYPEAEKAYYESRYSEAIMTALEGLSQTGIQEEDAVELYSILGCSYSRLGDFDKAADYMIRCYEWDKKHGEKKGLTSSLINLASMYVYAGKPELAAGYALEAIANEEAIGRPDKLSMACGKACDVYHAAGKDSLALVYADRAVSIAGREPDRVSQAIRRSQRAYALEGLGRYDAALKDLLFAEDVFRRENIKQSLGIVCFQLGQEYGRRGRSAAEKQYLKEAAALAEELGDQPLMEKIYHRLALATKDTDPDAAFGYLERSMALKDSISRRKSSVAMELFNIEYETMRREQTIVLQKSEIEAEKRLNLVLTLLALLLLAAAAVILLYTFRLGKERRKLKESNAQKDFLFKVVSHDIHAPAMAQLRSMQMLRTHGAGLAPAELGQVYLQLERQAESEVELIDNVLRWARTKTEAPEPVRFALDEMVGEVIGQYSGSARSKDISVSLESPDDIVVCSIRSNLMLALRNLLSNAIKFSPKGSPVTIAIEPATDGALLSVSDRGIGIPKNRIPFIFNADGSFRRSGTDGEPSNGLGLTVTRDLVEETGSTIGVESEEGNGSRFTIHIKNLQENA